MKKIYWTFIIIPLTIIISCSQPAQDESNYEKSNATNDSLNHSTNFKGHYSFTPPSLPSSISSYDDILNWDTLLFESEEFWSEEFKAYWMKPLFEAHHKVLMEKETIHHGILTKSEIDSNSLYLYRPGLIQGCVREEYDECRVIQLHFDIQPNDLLSDKTYEVFVKGFLDLNSNEYKEHFLILKNVNLLWSKEIKSDTSILYLKDIYFKNYVLQHDV